MTTLKRIFSPYPDKGRRYRWRCRSAHNGNITAVSGEDFDGSYNAVRAARREASLYPTGVAAVESTHTAATKAAAKKAKRA